jgi:hypothetical protein
MGQENVIARINLVIELHVIIDMILNVFIQINLVEWYENRSFMNATL